MKTVFSPPFYEGCQWAVPASPEVIEGLQTFFAQPDSYPVDGRGLTFTFAFFSPKHLGAGQFYLMTVKQYWSATAYDRATHALIRNLPWASRSSQTPGIQKNADGSVDVFFGPTAPQGKETNWVPTDADGRFEVLFRFYGPEKPLFDKTWQLPDVEKVSVQ